MGVFVSNNNKMVLKPPYLSPLRTTKTAMNITENGTYTITPPSGYDALDAVDITVNVNQIICEPVITLSKTRYTQSLPTGTGSYQYVYNTTFTINVYGIQKDLIQEIALATALSSSGTPTNLTNYLKQSFTTTGKLKIAHKATYQVQSGSSSMYHYGRVRLTYTDENGITQTLYSNIV